MPKVIILTGPVHSGKTTSLQELIAQYPDRFAGILAPVIDRQRYLLDISTGEQQCLECPVDEQDKLPVGPYVFSQTVFRWARQRLAGQAGAFPGRWLIIDEVGKLELKNQGLAPTAIEVIRQTPNDMIVVVRDTLLSCVVQHLIRIPHKLISKEELRKELFRTFVNK